MWYFWGGVEGGDSFFACQDFTYLFFPLKAISLLFKMHCLFFLPSSSSCRMKLLWLQRQCSKEQMLSFYPELTTEIVLSTPSKFKAAVCNLLGIESNRNQAIFPKLLKVAKKCEIASLFSKKKQPKYTESSKVQIQILHKLATGEEQLPAHLSGHTVYNFDRKSTSNKNSNAHRNEIIEVRYRESQEYIPTGLQRQVLCLQMHKNNF